MIYYSIYIFVYFYYFCAEEETAIGLNPIFLREAAKKSSSLNGWALMPWPLRKYFFKFLMNCRKYVYELHEGYTFLTKKKLSNEKKSLE